MQYREEIETLVAHVKSWPMEDRVALAYEILRDMRLKPIGDPPRQTLAGAVGIARGTGPVPSDEDVKRWIEEERLKHREGSFERVSAGGVYGDIGE